ncbi:hypothetical protein H7827_25790 [Streptomyces sp. JH002]|uniref:Uncharacterized protein n=1 Tax=Streptomyces xiamenensis TaxID=408015 RepID=A0A0F7FPN3_9ACTN|nr:MULTISPECIES: hypothetical protein [Streptomyces]AKG41964.1 hypothetical protein SXIM_05800 [Streptomyces xiamenensis]MCU4748902.1 hypothetical protein [Streptomyces sp. G-5]QQN80341.1 hypothetical protein IPZ77_25220 [Streptomyces sp. XC 2026]
MITAAGTRPVPPRLGDRSEWVLGRCWLWCGNRHTWVLWLGQARTTGHHAPLYACEECVDRLHHTIIDYGEAMTDAPVDGSGIRVPLYLAADETPWPGPVRYRRGRHRRPRTALGRLWERVITGRSAR